MSLTHIINLSALKCAIPVVSKSNFLISDLIHAEHQLALINHFPKVSFFELKRDESHASVDESLTFRFSTTKMIDETNFFDVILSHSWCCLIQALTHIEYINHLSELIEFDLTKARWGIDFFRYSNGDWLDEHYDRQENKILTQLFYFNHYWDITWGGHLHILHPDDLSLSVLTIPPTINYSVIILAKKDAWHKVGKVQSHAKQPRLGMALQLYR